MRKANAKAGSIPNATAFPIANGLVVYFLAEVRAVAKNFCINAKLVWSTGANSREFNGI
jgi:hypothetical protein